VLGLGASLVIVTGGIDLSIGSVVCLVGCLLPWLLVGQGWPVALAVPAVLALGLGLGLVHGLLVTRLRLQPFLVTLCGLLLYRGVARGITGDQPQGFRGGYQTLRALGNGEVPLPGMGGFALPVPCLVLLGVALAAAVFLSRTVWGRHLRAIGRSETAARHAGIDSARLVTLAYGLAGLLSALGGMLFVLDVGSAQPSDFGSFYELYAIAAAVLGGCTLRGGEVTVLGVVLGAAVMQVLRNAITLVEAIPDHVEYAVIGVVLLAGVAADELVRRAVARRRARPPPG
jgi:ribose transport system permease protein